MLFFNIVEQGLAYWDKWQ